MALIKFGNGVAAISGRIDGTVFSRVRGGAIARGWTKPVGTPTPAQTVARARLGASSGDWSELTASQRVEWNDFAPFQTRINRFGEPYTPTGRQLFIEASQNIKIIGEAPIVDAPPNGDVLPWNSDFVEGGTVAVVSTAGAITAITQSNEAYAGISSGSLIIDATAPFQNTKNNFTNQFRTLMTADASAVPTILSIYNAFYSSPTVSPGQVIAFRYRLVNNINGFSTAPLIIVSTITGT